MRQMYPTLRTSYAFALFGCLAASALGSCATMVHTPVTEATDKDDRGVRYYRVSPYLIAYSNGKGGVKAEIKFLPDTSKKMSVHPETTLADVKSTLTFENGALTSTEDTGDATGVVKAVAEAVTKFGTALISAGDLPEGAREVEALQPKVPAPYIYKIVVKNNVVELIGGKRPEPFRITLLPQPPPKKEKD